MIFCECGDEITEGGLCVTCVVMLREENEELKDRLARIRAIECTLWEDSKLVRQLDDALSEAIEIAHED